MSDGVTYELGLDTRKLDAELKKARQSLAAYREEIGRSGTTAAGRQMFSERAATVYAERLGRVTAALRAYREALAPALRDTRAFHATLGGLGPAGHGAAGGLSATGAAMRSVRASAGPGGGGAKPTLGLSNTTSNMAGFLGARAGGSLAGTGGVGLAGMAGGFLAAKAAAELGRLAKESIHTAARLDRLKMALAATGDQSMSVAEKMRQLNEAAKLPGMGLEEAASGVLRLQGAGMSFEQAIGTVVEFGNALASVGRGAAELDGVTLALSQISAKGKVTAEEINQIAERMPQIRQVMQETFGTGVAEDIAAMGVSADAFISAVTARLARMPRVVGGMAAEMENFDDAVKRTKASFGEFMNFLVSPFRRGATVAMDALFGGAQQAAAAQRDLSAAGQETLETLQAQAAAAQAAAAAAKEAAAAEERNLSAKRSLGINDDTSGVFQRKKAGLPADGLARQEGLRALEAEIVRGFGTLQELRARFAEELAQGNYTSAQRLKNILTELQSIQDDLAASTRDAAALFTPFTGELGPRLSEDPGLAQTRQEAMEAFAEALEMARAREAGDEKEIARLERKRDIEAERLRLIQAGVEASEAARMAADLVDTRARADVRAGFTPARRKDENARFRIRKLTPEEAAARAYLNQSAATMRRNGTDDPEEFLRKSGRQIRDKDKFNEVLRKLRDERANDGVSKQQLQKLEAIEKHLTKVTVA